MADTKVTALTELASIATGDILYVVDDPGGTPLSKKITIDNVLDASLVSKGTLAHERGGLEADVSAGDGFVEIKGGSTTVIKSNTAAAVAPGASDDSGSGYAVGSTWIDTTANKAYVCLDASAAAAVWTETTQAGGGIANVVEDVTPQLGGDLDVNGQSIISASNGDITITPNGTGAVVLGAGLVESSVADGASAVAFDFDTQNAMTTSGAKIFRIADATSEALHVDKDGYLKVTSTRIYGSGAAYISMGSHFTVPAAGTSKITGSSFALAVSESTATTNADLFFADNRIIFPRGATNDCGVFQGDETNSDRVVNDFYFKAGDAYASASTNLDGGNIVFVAGAGASGSAGDADGGHIYLDGGQGYGTGDHGGIYIANTRGRMSFFAAAPVAQQSGTGETTGFTAGAGTAVNDDSTFTGNVGSTAYRISDVVKALKNYGLLAS